jgi:uncharacterized protein
MEVIHDKDNSRFILNIKNEIAKVDYVLKHDKMFLTHTEVPQNLSGQGIGKILVEKTFEKLTEEGYKAVALCPYANKVAKRSDKWKNVIKN